MSGDQRKKPKSQDAPITDSPIDQPAYRSTLYKPPHGLKVRKDQLSLQANQACIAWSVFDCLAQPKRTALPVDPNSPAMYLLPMGPMLHTRSIYWILYDGREENINNASIWPGSILHPPSPKQRVQVMLPRS